MLALSTCESTELSDMFFIEEIRQLWTTFSHFLLALRSVGSGVGGRCEEYLYQSDFLRFSIMRPRFTAISAHSASVMLLLLLVADAAFAKSCAQMATVHYYCCRCCCCVHRRLLLLLVAHAAADAAAAAPCWLLLLLVAAAA